MKIVKLKYYKNTEYSIKLKNKLQNILLEYDRSKSNLNQINYFNFLIDCFNKNINFGSSIIQINCNYCNNPFEISLRTLLDRTHYSDFGYSKLNCKNKQCEKDHKRFVIQKQTELGKTSAQGHIVTKEQILRMLETNKNSEKVKKQSDNRRGKNFEEYYGKEKAKIIKDKIKYARSIQKDPHLNCKNNQESKNLMSLKRLEFFKNNPNFSKEYGLKISKNYWSLTEEQRSKRRLASAKGRENSFSKRSRNWGYHKAWWQKLEDKDQTYQSNYELTYYRLLDEQKIYYKTNYKIYLPYISPIDNEKHFYIPDVLIFDSNWILIEITEVKPYEFAYNPNNNESIYYKITKEKLIVLKEYCILNNLKCNIITEKELNL